MATLFLGGGQELGINPIAQQQALWCWAACAEMILVHLGRSLDQCTLANVGLGRGDCCASSDSAPECNVGMLVLSANGSEPDIMSLYRGQNVGALHRSRDVLAGVLKDEIEAGRPVEISFDWGRRTGHVILVVGWQPSDEVDDPYFIINDPQTQPPQKGLVTYSSLQSALGFGIWAETILGIGA